MKTKMINTRFALTVILFLVRLSCIFGQITNVHFERSVDLMEQGSNLITFQSSIQFTNPKQESEYYYAIAKDYKRKLVAFQAYIEHPDDSS